MDAEGFRYVAEQEFNQLPVEFRELMQNVIIIIDDFADDEVLAAMQIASSFELLGLYEGVPITQRDAVASGTLPDMIHLYRLPILAMQAEREADLSASIRNVLVHEIGHYFGFSDAEMDKIEQGFEYDE